MGFYPNLSGMNISGALALGMDLAEKKRAREAEQATLERALKKEQLERENETFKQMRDFPAPHDEEGFSNFYEYAKRRTPSKLPLIESHFGTKENFLSLPESKRKVLAAKWDKDYEPEEFAGRKLYRKTDAGIDEVKAVTADEVERYQSQGFSPVKPALEEKEEFKPRALYRKRGGAVDEVEVMSHPEYQKYRAQGFEDIKPGTQAGGGAKEREIQRYLDLGIADTPAQATKLAEGLYKIGQDDLGRSVIIDVSDGSVVKPLDQKEEGPTEDVERKPFVTVEEVEKALGPGASTKQIINNVFGGFISGQIFADTEKARNKVYTFNQRMRPYLQVSARGAKFDVENIDKILPNPDSFFQDPDAARGKLQNVYNLIKGTIDKKQQLIAEGDITKDQQQAFIDDINKLYTSLSLLPDEEMLFSDGLTPERIKTMGVSEIKQLDLSTLTPEQKKILEDRVDELRGM